ncbi:hypothetical protein SDC9_82511 [bioreactor metagenome]|uniref:Uncharacterized protein n=1 Tax=bioreactor metagenome TaxID=1076179 RepID=A0A644Z5L7_9ZZZZ
MAILPEAIVYIAEGAIVRVQILAHAGAQEPSPCLGVRCGGLVTPGDEIEHRVRVVHRDVDIRHVVQVVGRNQHRGGGNEHGGANVIILRRIGDGSTNGGVAEAVGGAMHLHARRLVGGGAQPILVRGFGAAHAGGDKVGGVQAGAVR